MWFIPDPKVCGYRIRKPHRIPMLPEDLWGRTAEELEEDVREVLGLNFPRRDWLPFDSVWGDEA